MRIRALFATFCVLLASLAFTATAFTQQALPESAPLYPPLVVADGKPKVAAHRVRLENATVELALQVLAPGLNIEAVRIDNLGGISALWRSDGKEGAAPLSVGKDGKSLSSGAQTMNFSTGDAEVLLSLSLTDNGAFAEKAAEFRVTVFFAGGERAMCSLGQEAVPAVAQSKTAQKTHAGSVIEGLHADIVLLVDTTRSMGPYIDRTRDMFVAASKALASDDEISKRLHFGVWGYRDSLIDIPGMEYLTKNYTPALQNLADFVVTMGTVKASTIDPVDFPKDVFSGLSDAIEKTAWIPGSLRFLVLIGDAPGHELGHKWNYSGLDETTARALATKNNITLIAIQIRPQGAVKFQKMAEKQFKTLALGPGMNDPAYYSVDGGDMKSFNENIGLVVASIQNILNEAQKGTLAQSIAENKNLVLELSGEMATLAGKGDSPPPAQSAVPAQIPQTAPAPAPQPEEAAAPAQSPAPAQMDQTPPAPGAQHEEAAAPAQSAGASRATGPALYKEFFFGQSKADALKTPGFTNCGTDARDVLCRPGESFAGADWTLELLFEDGALAVAGLSGPFDENRYVNAMGAILNNGFSPATLQASGGETFEVLEAMSQKGQEAAARELDAFENKGLQSGHLTYTFVQQDILRAAVAKKRRSWLEMISDAPAQTRAVEMEISEDDGEASMSVRFLYPAIRLQKQLDQMKKQKEAF